MTDKHTPAENAWLFLRQLAVEIGPRPAGQRGEKTAHDYITNLLTAWGFEVQRAEVPFAPPGWQPYLLMGPFIAAGTLLYNRIPALVLVLPFIIAFLPDWSRRVIRHRKTSLSSENIFTVPLGPAEAPLLLLSAHVDSAPAVPYSHPVLLRFRARMMDIVERSAFFLAAAALLTWIGLPFPALLEILIHVAGLSLAILLTLLTFADQFTGKSSFSPGANDNASGVAVLLALAQANANRRFTHMRLGFLFTGAEETGLHGARAAAASLDHDPNTSIITLDMVGAGDCLRFSTQDGIIKPLHASAELNDLIQRCDPSAKGLWYSIKSGDFAPFLAAGFAATGLQITGSSQAELAYHTRNDTLENIELSALQKICALLKCIIDSMDSHKPAADVIEQ